MSSVSEESKVSYKHKSSTIHYFLIHSTIMNPIRKCLLLLSGVKGIKKIIIINASETIQIKTKSACRIMVYLSNCLLLMKF